MKVVPEEETWQSVALVTADEWSWDEHFSRMYCTYMWGNTVLLKCYYCSAVTACNQY